MFDEVSVTITARPPAQGGLDRLHAGSAPLELVSGAGDRSGCGRRRFSLRDCSPLWACALVSSAQHGADDGNWTVGEGSSGEPQLRNAGSGHGDVHRAVPEVDPGDRRRRDDRRHAQRADGVGVRSSAGVLLPARGRPRRHSRSLRPSHHAVRRRARPRTTRFASARRSSRTAPGTTPSRSRQPSRSRT